MMIKCPKCNFENQLGSIFCRSCGAKLDLEHMTPQKESFSVDFKGIFQKLRSLLSALISLGLVFLVCSIFLPWGFDSYVKPEKDEMGKAKAKFERLQSSLTNHKAAKYTFTGEELSAILNECVLEKSKSGSGYAIQDILIRTPDDDLMYMTMHTKFSGIVPVVFQLSGTPVLEDGKWSFQVKSAKAGHLPMLFGAEKIVTDKFLPLCDGIVKTAMDAATEVKMDDSKLELKIAAGKK